MRASVLVLLASLLLAGCHLKEVPVDARSNHRSILWRQDFLTARADALATSKPLLLVVVAGERDDRC